MCDCTRARACVCVCARVSVFVCECVCVCVCVCFAFCFVFCVAFIFCDLRLIFVLCLFYVHLHHLFAVILYNATNSSDTDIAGKHKICKTRFVRTHKLPITPCSMPFNVCFDEIILNFVPPFFFNTYFCFQCNLHKHKKQTQTQTQEQTHTTNTQHKHTAHKHTSGGNIPHLLCNTNVVTGQNCSNT